MVCRSGSPDSDDSDIPELESDESDEDDDSYDYTRDRYTRRAFAKGRTWAPATNYHIDALIQGTTPLLLAVRAGNVRMAKALLESGADPLTACAATAPSSSKKADSSSSSWTTPLHLAVEMNQVKLLQHMVPGLKARSEILKPKSFATPKIPVVNSNEDVKAHTQRSVTIYNCEGDTPLTLAVRLGYYNAAVALLGAGFSLCQVVSVYTPESSKEEHTHALLLTVKVGAS